MKKFEFFAVSLLVSLCSAVLFVACGYDDDDLWKSVGDLDDRVTSVESRLDALNSDIASLRGIVAALEGKVYVERVETTSDGYVIRFSDGSEATIRNGRDGAAGQPGADGRPGADAPIIGAKQDADGIYYWTLTADGKSEWLLDASGAKLPVSGVSPVLSVDAEGYWTVSYDGGRTYARVTDAAGNPVPSAKDTAIFGSVTCDDEQVRITLADGTEIVLPRSVALSMTIVAVGQTEVFDFGQTKIFEVESTGVEKVVAVKPDEWRVSYADGKLVVTAPAQEHAACAELEGEVALMYYGANNTSGAVSFGVKVERPIVLAQLFDSLHTPGVAAENGDNFYLGLSTGATATEGGLTVPVEPGYVVWLDLYGTASETIPAATYSLEAGHVPPSADPRHTYAVRRTEDGGCETVNFESGAVVVESVDGDYVLAATFVTTTGQTLKFRFEGAIELGKIDMTGNRIKHAVNVELDQATAVCYKEYNDPGVDWTQLKLWTGEVDTRGGLRSGTLFAIELNMPTTEDRDGLKLVEGTYEINPSREAFTMVPGAVIELFPGYTMTSGTYCQQSDANGTILSGGAQDAGRVTVRYEAGVYRIDVALISDEGISMRGTYTGAIDVQDK